jgi:CubicO group peptidase (beta-lactamase class C family)
MKQLARALTASAALSSLLAAALVAQAPAPARPATPTVPAARHGAGFSSERLTRLDKVLDAYVESGQLPGAVAMVLRDGRPVYQRAVGWADREAGRKMTVDTIFRIASQTKAITSVAALSLVEEGAISLSDPVSRFIPSFAKTSVAVGTGPNVTVVPARRPITIRDLLTHTAGISYGVQPEIAAQYEAKGLGPAAGFGWFLADKSEPVCEAMARLGTLPFVAQPGEAWVYGYNTDVLGCVVERAAKQPLDQVIRERVTGPLGMRDTHFFLPEADRARLAAVYASTSGGTFTRAPEGPRGQGTYVDGPRKTFAGGAGLLSTVRDYGRFLEMVRNGGALDGVRILGPRMVSLMSTNQVGTLHSATGLGFGLGFETTDRYGANGMDGVGAYGWAGAYGTIYRVDPSARMVLMLMIQLLPNATDIRERFPAMVYQALLDPPATR